MPRQTIRRGPRLPLPWERAQQPFRLFLVKRRFVPVLGALLVAGFFYTAYRLGSRRADVRATRATLAEVERATRAFLADLGRCPEDVNELVHPPKSGTQYLSEPPLDAWNRAPFLRCVSGPQNEHAEIEVLSAGPSGSFLDEDNVM
jgi:hypothetical protein